MVRYLHLFDNNLLLISHRVSEVVAMKFNFLNIVLLVLGLSLGGSALATPIIDTVSFSQTLDITETPQNFEFNIESDFELIDTISLDSATFFVNASGNFNNNDEVLFLFGGALVVNGNGVLFNAIDNLAETSFESSTIVENVDVDFSAEFSLSPDDIKDTLDVILVDGGFFIDGFTSTGVNSFPFISVVGSNADFVEVGFRFNIVDASEPTTLAIFALGLIGLAARRLKKI